MMKRSRFATMMDKQGVYLIVFLCLGIIGVAAYFTMGGNGTQAKKPIPTPTAAQVGQMGNGLTGPTTTPKTTPLQTPIVTPTPTPVATPTPSATAKPVTAAAQKAVLPVTGEVLRPFSQSEPVFFETLNAWMTHNGVDISCALGTGVKAALDGKIKSIKNDPETGYTIVLTHEGDIETVYGNLNAPQDLEVGQLVTQGQIIGAVGQSSPSETADGAHLHFAYLRKGIYKDPIAVCQAK